MEITKLNSDIDSSKKAVDSITTTSQSSSEENN